MGTACSSAKAVQLSTQGTQASPPGSPPPGAKSSAVGTSPYKLRDAASRSPDSGVSSGTLLAYSEPRVSDDEGAESRDAGTQTLSGPGGKILTARSSRKHVNVPVVRQNAVSAKRERLSRDIMKREVTNVSMAAGTRRKSPKRRGAEILNTSTKSSNTRSSNTHKSRTPRSGNYSTFPSSESPERKPVTTGTPRSRKYTTGGNGSPTGSVGSDEEFDTRDPENRPMSAVFGKFRSRASRDTPRSMRKTHSEPQPLSRMSNTKSNVDLSSASSDEELTNRTYQGMKGGKLKQKSPKQAKEMWVKEGKRSKLNIVGKSAEIHEKEGKKGKSTTPASSYFIPLDKSKDEVSKARKDTKKKGQAFFIGEDGECEMIGEDAGTWSSAFEDETGSEISMPDETQDKQYHRSGKVTNSASSITILSC